MKHFRTLLAFVFASSLATAAFADGAKKEEAKPEKEKSCSCCSCGKDAKKDEKKTD